MSRSHTPILVVSVRSDTRYSWCPYVRKYYRITKRKPSTSRSGFCRYTVDKVDTVDSLWKLHNIDDIKVMSNFRDLSTKCDSTTITNTFINKKK